MNMDEFEEIMEADRDFGKVYEGDRVLLGIAIIQKYLPKSGIEAAEHDIIFSASAEELVDAGITKEDALELRSMGWMLEFDSLAHFV